MSGIPELEHGCGSWVVTRISDGEVIGEFYDRRTVERFDPGEVRIETALQYLQRLNREIVQKETAGMPESYRGWKFSYRKGGPVTGKFNAERKGVEFQSGTIDGLKRMVDQRIRDYPHGGDW